MSAHAVVITFALAHSAASVQLPKDWPGQDGPDQGRGTVPREVPSLFFGTRTNSTSLPTWKGRTKKMPNTTCVVVPVHPPDFDKAALLLMDMKRLARDPVFPMVYVVVGDKAEQANWTAHVVGKRNILLEHTILTFDHISGIGVSELLQRNEKASKHRTTDCQRSGSSGTHIIVHMKKLFSLSYIGQHSDCDMAWVMDSESLPLREFRFDKVFSQFGTILARPSDFTFTFKETIPPVHDIVSCASHAELIHKQPLSQWTRSLDFRENDFWLMEPKLVHQMMLDACGGTNKKCFIDEYLMHGTMSEQVVYNSWLAQKVFDGKMPNYTVKYTSSLKVCLQSDYVPQIDFKCLGKVLRWGLDQQGTWGNFLSEDRVPVSALSDIVTAVPWCVSNCQHEKILRWRRARQ